MNRRRFLAAAAAVFAAPFVGVAKAAAPMKWTDDGRRLIGVWNGRIVMMGRMATFPSGPIFMSRVDDPNDFTPTFHDANR